VVVLAPAECVNDFDENLLKDVLRERVVFHKKINRGVDFCFVALEQGFEGCFVTIYIAGDQFLIVEHWHNLHEQSGFAVLPVKLKEFNWCTSFSR
jgi:hypothetical protein